MTYFAQCEVHGSQKVWDSGIGLSSWLVGLFQGTTDSGVSTSVVDLRGALTAQDCKVIELGERCTTFVSVPDK